MQKVLFIGVNWPELTTAAGTRMMQLLQLFLKRNDQVTFASAASESDFSIDLNALQISKAPIKLNSASFDVFVFSHAARATRANLTKKRTSLERCAFLCVMCARRSSAVLGNTMNT